jgi:hypothetical protein
LQAPKDSLVSKVQQNTKTISTEDMGSKCIQLEDNGNEIELGPWSMFKVQATHNAPPKERTLPPPPS